MDYFPALIIISLIGGIVSVDTTAGWQIMISQPIVSCTVIGLIFGQPDVGITLGIILGLPWLINVPSGGTHGSESNLGGVVAAGLSAFFVSQHTNFKYIIIVITIIYSLGIGMAGTYLVNIARNFNLNLSHVADRAIEKADFNKIAYLNFYGVFSMFFIGILLCGAGFSLGVVLLEPLIRFIHPNFEQAFQIAKYGILGVGFGAVATLFINKKTAWYIIAGIAVSAVIFFLVF